MMHADSLVPVAVRREHVQQRVAENRAAIAVAWADVGVATIALEAKAHRALAWTRMLSAIAAVTGGLVALRRLDHPVPRGPRTASHGGGDRAAPRAVFGAAILSAPPLNGE